MKQSLLSLLCAISLVVFVGCTSPSPFGDDGHLNCLTVPQLESIPKCDATVEKITPCSVNLRTDDGLSLWLAGPMGADSEILRFMDTLEEGHTYTLPDEFIEFREKQERPNKTNGE
jgi:hypothetical protein